MTRPPPKFAHGDIVEIVGDPHYGAGAVAKVNEIIPSCDDLGWKYRGTYVWRGSNVTVEYLGVDVHEKHLKLKKRFGDG